MQSWAWASHSTNSVLRKDALLSLLSGGRRYVGKKKKEPTTGWVTLCLTPLGYPDSNQERQDQNLQCYHYTIAQEEKRRHPEDTHAKTKKEVGLPGLEPGKAGPESAVLPLHHSPRRKKAASRGHSRQN